MNHACLKSIIIGSLAAIAFGTQFAHAQQPAIQKQDAYRRIAKWAALPEGRTFGEVSGVSIDSNGNIWAFERCGGGTCSDRPEAPILCFDSSGRLIKSFGAGMFVFPHGIFVDKNDNVWVADGDGKGGKGHQVVKFNSKGEVLLTLGTAGVPGADKRSFNRPSGVAVGPSGDIFVADGHGEDSNARIVKFDAKGNYLLEWGKKGTSPGEFGQLHGIATDSNSRVYVVDRGNNRIQIFDSKGAFIDQWKQFGRPSSVFIDKQNRIYVADNAATSGGISIGNAKDGQVSSRVPDPDPAQAVGDVVADDNGALYGAAVQGRTIKKFVKQ